MTELGDVDPDEEDDGDVPILQHCQARHNLTHFRISYTNEQCEYYSTTV